jgi:hypothetical protein
MGRTPTGAVPDQRRLWSPVRTAAADSYWILLIVTLALTVIITRVSLELTGYPQIGDSTYHVAHVLWGGLAMFVALVLPLTFANPYIPWATAILGGIGAGLFIDEVGKFITQGNDYFFPLAFPIIYSFILVCVWFALRLRAFHRPDTRHLLYYVLEDVKQVLDNDLDPLEHAELRDRLIHVIRETADVEERVLAEALLNFCRNRAIRLAESPTVLQQTWHRGRALAFRLPPRPIMRGVLVVSFGYTALNSVVELVTFVGLFWSGGRSALLKALGESVIMSGKAAYVVNNPILSAVHASAIVVAGVLALGTAVLLLSGRDQAGLRLGTASLAISLLIVNLLSFYFSQLYALLSALGETALLLVAMLYRWRFLRHYTREVER